MENEKNKKDLRINSFVYDGVVKSPNRAMLRATGMHDEDFKKLGLRTRLAIYI